jgi:hypothetical protein
MALEKAAHASFRIVDAAPRRWFSTNEPTGVAFEDEGPACSPSPYEPRPSEDGSRVEPGPIALGGALPAELSRLEIVRSAFLEACICEPSRRLGLRL